MSTVCRVCVAGNVKLYSLDDNVLIDVYENLCNTKFNSQDARPRAVCSFCYQKLLRCRAFSEMARRSEKIFSKLFHKGHEATQVTITKLNLNTEPNLSISPVKFYNLGEDMHESSLVIKHEPITIKEEIFDDEVETGSFNSIKTEGITKDNGGNVETDNKNWIHITVKEEMVPEEDVAEVEVERITKKEIEEITEEDPLDTPLLCNVCVKQFDDESELNEHMRIHTNEKFFICNICNKRCTRKTDLKVHMRTHTGKRPIQCNLCDKKFYTKTLLVRHMRIHSGEKPFPCNVCEKQFYNKSNLDRHVGTHKGEKPFPCSVCGKRYTQKHVLIVHMRIHTGERPFPCNVKNCDKKFYSKSHLVQHMKHHNGEKRFACNVCDKLFFQKSYLMKHSIKHIKDKPQQ